MALAARASAVVVALALLAACGTGGPPVAAPAATAPGLPTGLDVAIERVVDGDTVVVTGKQTVRLIGVDAPVI